MRGFRLRTGLRRKAQLDFHKRAGPSEGRTRRSGWMPRDSTQLKLDEVKRDLLFGKTTVLTGELAELTKEWGQKTPTLFDAMAVAYAIEPKLCPVTRLRIQVDKDGFTREMKGEPNVSACLESDAERFYRFAMPRWMKAGEKTEPRTRSVR